MCWEMQKPTKRRLATLLLHQNGKQCLNKRLIELAPWVKMLQSQHWTWLIADLADRKSTDPCLQQPDPHGQTADY